MAQQIIGVFDPPRAPQWATVECGPQRARTASPLAAATSRCAPDAAPSPAPAGGGENDQGAFAEGRRVAVETIEHQLPAPIHGGFNHCVIRHIRVGLQERRQSQLRGWHGRMALRLVFIKRRQCLLKRVTQQSGAVLPQEHKPLGTTDALDDRVLRATVRLGDATEVDA